MYLFIVFYVHEENGDDNLTSLFFDQDKYSLHDAMAEMDAKYGKYTIIECKRFDKKNKE